ncbi:recombinase family protein [Thermobifida halotolerans]|uniref:recombinase family protein n=1 Tax=Thermobifida halotolerans TaxID=483545 RepID=UPI000A9C8F90
MILTVHELKRLARNAAELMALSAQLQADGVRLELLTGPLTGVYDPNGMGSMLFAVLAVAAQLDRNYIREKTLEGQVAAAAKGNHGGRPRSSTMTCSSSSARSGTKASPSPRSPGS